VTGRWCRSQLASSVGHEAFRPDVEKDRQDRKTDKPDQSDSPQSQAPLLAVQGGSVAKQSLLAAKELAAQVKTLDDGDDIEEHLRRLDDMAELMMVDDMVKYQAMLLPVSGSELLEK